MRELLQDTLKKEDINLDSNKIDMLENFAKKLEWYNKTHNISGARDAKAIVDNIIDSLIPIKFMPKPNSLLDVGTGAGFPGLILATIWSDIDVTLAEPINKRATFLRLVAYELGLNKVTIFKDRVEKLKYKSFALVTSRAVTNTKLLLELTKNIVNIDTNYLFFKGERVFNEIEELNNQYIYDIIKSNKRNYLWIKGLK